MSKIFIKKAPFLFLLFCVSMSVEALEITRMEPPCWWVGMKNTELQIMVYGKDIARSELQFDYPDVRLKEIVRTENPNYLFIYLNVGKEAQSGMIRYNTSDVSNPCAPVVVARGFNSKVLVSRDRACPAPTTPGSEK